MIGGNETLGAMIQKISDEKNVIIKFKVINIQGLTKAKYIEIEEPREDNTIVCLTETLKVRYNN